MSELEEYKKLVAERLNAIGEIMAHLVANHSEATMPHLDLFKLGDDEFAEFAFGLDCLFDDLLHARHKLEIERQHQQNRAELWQNAAKSFSTSQEVFETLLNLILTKFSVDLVGYFVSEENDPEYRFVAYKAKFEIGNTRDLHFEKKLINLHDEGIFIKYLNNRSPLFAWPATRRDLAFASDIVHEHGLNSILVVSCADANSHNQVAMVICSKNNQQLDLQDQQTIAALTVVQFARYNQLRTQEKLVFSNQNLEKAVETRTHELSMLNRRLKLDLLDRELAERQIKENRDMYQTLFETIPDPILIFTAVGQITNANQAAVQFFGFNKPQEITIHYLRDFIDFSYSDLELFRLNKIVEKEIRELDGTCHICEMTISDLNIYASSPTNTKLCIIHDITNRRRQEKELARIQNMESLGILAGGIAHDFNNILSGIAGSLYVASKTQETNPAKAQRLLENAHNSIIKAKSLTAQLLTFAKGGEPVKQIIDIRDIIDESINFALAGSNVACQLSISDELWLVEGDHTQLAQVFTNLVLNAAQAAPGTILDLGAETIYLKEGNQENLPEGNYIHVTVADRGPGIPPDTAAYIYHPFYTTKPNGTGLGLTIVFSVIKKHNGLVRHESREGGGTIFHVFLPAISHPRQQQPTTGELEENFQAEEKGNRRVLIMDDDDTIREMAGEITTYLDFEPQLAANGEEAITAYQQAQRDGNPFLCVILDLTVVGGMGGKETMNKLIEIDSNAYGIVVSGYSNDPVMANYSAYGFSDLLAKPYTINELKKVLLQAVRKNGCGCP